MTDPASDPEPEPDPLLERLRATAKYRTLCDDVLRWALGDARRRTRSDKEALKVAKRKLHQAFGSFVDASQRKAVLRHLGDAADAAHGSDPVRYTAALEAALVLHTSTAERILHLSALWGAVLAAVDSAPGVSRASLRVLDLGCGVAPAALPWSGLPAGVHYLGVDLDEALCAALQAAVRPAFPHTRVRAAEVRNQAFEPTDVALLWKLLPTLERQEAGSAHALVARLDARVLVATFPTRTLTGRDRGMEDQYRALADAVLGPATPGGDLRIGDELVRIVVREPRPQS